MTGVQRGFSLKLTLFRYIFRDICSLFFVSLLVFVFVIMGTKMLWIADLLTNQNVAPILILKIIYYLLPRIIIFSLPAACLMCVLLTFLRLSADNEVIALNSSGISLYQLLPPVIFFSLLSFLLGSLMALYLVPAGNRSYRNVVFQIMESKVDIQVKERIFYEPFDNMIFYVNSFSPKEKEMKDLFVVDKREKSNTFTIVAKEGKVLSNPITKMITIRFTDGTIFTADKGTIKFDVHDLNINLEDIVAAMASREKKPEEMFIGELLQSLKTTPKKLARYNHSRIKIYEMFSIPVAVFFMGVIGLPLGINIRSNGRTIGIIISLVIFLIYNVILMSVRYICETGAFSPTFGMWIPDIFLLITCLYLIRRIANDRPIGIDY